MLAVLHKFERPPESLVLYKGLYIKELGNLLTLARKVLPPPRMQQRGEATSQSGTQNAGQACKSGIPKVSGTISTESRVKMLFLTLLAGHNLCFRVRRPRALFAGVILYQTTWVLLPGA